MKTWTNESIPLSAIELNIENPRFDVSQDEDAAIAAMLNNQKEKILNLAKDISENGLNPSDLTIVHKFPGREKYTVLEGNRRITALKLLAEPSLASKDPDLSKKFKKLVASGASVPKLIQCVVFKNPEEANKWIALKHTGLNDGVGTAPWNAQQSARFIERTTGKSDIALLVLDFVKSYNHSSANLKSKLSSLPLTNLNRLIADRGVQEFLGIRITKGELNVLVEPEELMKGLERIVNDLASKKIKVKDIYSKTNREQYLETFKPNEIPQKKPLTRVQVPTKKTPSPVAKPVALSQKAKSSIIKNISHSIERSTIIPKNCVMKFNNKRISNIYAELKKLNCDDFPNASAVLFRVFLEFSAEEALRKFSITLNGSDPTLINKIKEIAKQFKDRNILTADQLKPVNVSTGNPNTILSTHTFNAYVHNTYIHPEPKSLITAWDNFQLFVETIWNK